MKNQQKGNSNKVQDSTTNSHPTYPKQTLRSLSSVNAPTIHVDTSDEKLDYIMKTLITVVANQNKIMAEIDKFRTVFEVVIQKSNDPFVTTPEATRERMSHFDPIDSLEKLKEFNEELKNAEIFDKYVDGLSFICGRDTKTKGIDHCYLLVDKFFTRHFFTLCSWAGGSKGPVTKFPFKFYENVITLFFNLVHLADPKFTLEECEEFFKGVIKNCQRRNCPRVRSSKSKRRPKGLSYAIRNSGNEDYDCVSQPLKEEDIFFDDLSAELIDDDPEPVL